MKVTVESQECLKGHVFFPKIKPDGTIVYPQKCPNRHCRLDLQIKTKRRLKSLIKRARKKIRTAEGRA